MKAKTYTTKALKKKDWTSLNFSQGKVDGFDLARFQYSKLLMIGAGGIGTLVGLALVRKGLAHLDICDLDIVETQNLTRQLFSKQEIGRNKALCLARSLRKQGFFKSRITGFPYRFQELLEDNRVSTDYDAVMCGVDNNPTRVAASNFCRENNIPLVMSAVSRDGSQMYCTVQEPGKACFGCILPNSVSDDTYPCDLPGIIDIMQVVAGFSVYAIDTVLMKRYREWNLRSVCLDGSLPDTSVSVPRKDSCALCG